MKRERSNEDLQRHAVAKVAYAYLLPLTLFISATIELFRSVTTTRLVGVGIWLAFMTAGVVVRKVIMRSAHRDIEELHRRYRSQ